MPDVDLLIQLADYYNVELRELLDGERRSGKMKIGSFPADGPLISFCKGFTLGFAYSMMIVGVLYTSGYLARIKAYHKGSRGKEKIYMK